MILRGDRNVVKLDVDAGRQRPTIGWLAYALRRAGYRIEWLAERRSPGGKGWHLWLKLKPRPRTPQEVVALQAILGSDIMREACNLRRANLYERVPAFMRDRWNVLYAKRGD